MTEPREGTTRDLWAAVDAITAPTQRKIGRTEQADWLEELASDPGVTVCDVARYRAATVAYGHIPSLWDQATWALTTGSEASEGGQSPLRERSPADLDLMETMLQIREGLIERFATCRMPNKCQQPQAPKDKPADQMRQLASHVVTRHPDDVGWWTFRFAQWGRLLNTHLRALEHTAKPIRLRNAPCPLCRTRQVTIDSPTGPVVVPPLLIDFEQDWIRAATCTACGAAWFRGSDLGELADLLDQRHAETA
jgi:hypothetical protein